MKSLLLISLMSVLLSMCGGTLTKEVEPTATKDVIVEEETSETETATQEEPSSEVIEKPAPTGEMPDTARRQIIEHGAPDKARNDSVKEAKTKGKF